MNITEAHEAVEALARDMEAQGDKIGATHLRTKLAGLERELLTLARDCTGTLSARVSKRQS